MPVSIASNGIGKKTPFYFSIRGKLFASVYNSVLLKNYLYIINRLIIWR